jgi:hypothetical protein
MNWLCFVAIFDYCTQGYKIILLPFVIHPSFKWLNLDFGNEKSKKLIPFLVKNYNQKNI